MIAKRSVGAAGKALIFSVGSLDDAATEISAIYNLSEDEAKRIQPTNAHSALSSVQTTASGLFSETMGMSTRQAVSLAKKAASSGQKLKILRALVQAGPAAANAAVAGGKAVGKVASKTAGKGTPWGWIATAVYAVGTGSWFAYNLRVFSYAAYELVRERDNIVVPSERLNDRGMILLEPLKPMLTTIVNDVTIVGTHVAAAWQETINKGTEAVEASQSAVAKLTSQLKRFEHKPK